MMLVKLINDDDDIVDKIEIDSDVDDGCVRPSDGCVRPSDGCVRPSDVEEFLRVCETL